MSVYSTEGIQCESEVLANYVINSAENTKKVRELENKISICCPTNCPEESYLSNKKNNSVFSQGPEKVCIEAKLNYFFAKKDGVLIAAKKEFQTMACKENGRVLQSGVVFLASGVCGIAGSYLLHCALSVIDSRRTHMNQFDHRQSNARTMLAWGVIGGLAGVGAYLLSSQKNKS